jgi:uncharacterized metal-binding protein
MASGRQHDRLTRRLALPFGLLWWPALGPAGAGVAGLAFLIGGLWLSPDLDTPSRPTRRWGPLSLLWWPYRRLLSHRSLLSHAPLLGTTLRLAYLGVLGALAALLLAPLGGPAPARWLEQATALWAGQRPLLLTALVGLEASSWLHLLQDGDPIPRLPRPLRALRRLGRIPGHRRLRRQRGSRSSRRPRGSLR